MATEGTQTPAPRPNNNARTVQIVLIVLVVLFAGAAIYFFIQTQNVTKEKTVVESQNTDLETEIKQLDAKISTMDADIQSKDIDIDEKNRKVEEVNKQLEKARATINQLAAAGKLNKEQLEKYKGQVDTDAYYIQQYQAQIEELKKENAQLTTENRNLSSQVKVKDSTLAKTQAQTQVISTKLEAAKVLRAANFAFFGLKSSGKAIPADAKDHSLPSGRSETLKITFDILDNAAADPGPRTVYVAIVKPGDNLPYPNPNGGTVQVGGKDIPTSVSASINYDGSKQNVTVTYPKPKSGGWAKGQHTVNVYVDGALIGSSGANSFVF